MELKYSEDAKQDLRQFQDSLNAFNESGDNFLDKILIYARKLSSPPKIGASLQSKTDTITDFRFLVFHLQKSKFTSSYTELTKKQISFMSTVFLMGE